MKERTKGFLGLFLLFGTLLLACGIGGLLSRTEDYNAPLYISQDFVLTCNETYTITGELTNRTDQDIVISELKFHLNGTNHYAYVYERDLVIPANSEYRYLKTNIDYTVDLLDRVYIQDCIIDGIDYDLQYSSDGIVFENNANNLTSSTIMLIIGLVLLIAAIYIVINYFINKKKIKY